MATALRTVAAENDLQEIAFYIAVHEGRPQVAQHNVAEIIAKCDFYAENPELGTAAPHLGPDYRIFHYKRWVAIYRPIEDGIAVLRIVDGARDYPTLFG